MVSSGCSATEKGSSGLLRIKPQLFSFPYKEESNFQGDVSYNFICSLIVCVD